MAVRRRVGTRNMRTGVQGVPCTSTPVRDGIDTKAQRNEKTALAIVTRFNVYMVKRFVYIIICENMKNGSFSEKAS